MTPDERTLLTQFLGDLAQTQGVAKDPEAASMIDNAIRSNPDSAYVLVQHALLADQALHEAQAQIAQMKAQAAPPSQPQSSFLGGAGLGPSVAPQQSPWGQAAQQQPPQPSFFGGGPFAGGGPFGGGGGGLGSFLRSAGTTAAGVAGGEMLFSGLSGLFGGHHGGGWGGGGFGGGGFGGGENVTINNYGDDDRGGGGYDSDDGDRGGDDYS